MTPNRITLHCSDSWWGNADEITRWHTDPEPKGNGWADIGYHYVILNGFPTYEDYNKGTYRLGSDGTIEKGRVDTRQGAHVLGENEDNLGICLIGKRHFTATQMLYALPNLLHDLCTRYGIDASRIYGHYELDSRKTCPNFPVKKYVETIKELRI